MANMNWITRTIVCGFATAGVMFILIGCGNHGGSIYGGFGNAFHHHDSWEYGAEGNDHYGIVGIEYETQIHHVQPVYLRGAIEHNSDHKGRDKPGGNSARVTGHVKF